MGFPLTQSVFVFFFRMLQTQKTHIRVISFCCSKQENVTELNVMQNITIFTNVFILLVWY